LKALREVAGFTQEELATIAGLSVHAVSALERGERRRPHPETVRALSAALDLTEATRDALVASARRPDTAAVDELSSGALPLPPTVLLGREADVQILRHWMSDPAARLITLLGPGGVGKTRLALELARTTVDESATRVVFVSLAPIRDAAFVASAIAEALGMAEATAIDLPKRARAACQARATLLVLDNFEQVLAAAPLVADLMTSVAALRLLVTSRAPLHIRGEREYIVGPLDLETTEADTIDRPDLGRTAAVRLFVERVRDAQPDFRVTAANESVITAICRRLDALPLAMELAAPWLKVLSVDDLLRRLTDDVLLTTGGSRDLPERQQTMNSTVGWSYQLLNAQEQRAFRRFGALPSLFPIDAAAAVLAGRERDAAGYDAAIDAAASLIDKSLLVRAETSTVPTCFLYHMLDTVRAYAARELTASGERHDAMEGLVRYTGSEAALAADGLVGPAQVEWLDRVREDLESYRAALAWLIDGNRAGEASDVACGLMFFWMIRGRGAEGLRWYERILGLPDLSPAAESRLRVGAAAMLYTRGELARARDELTRALALAPVAGDAKTSARAEDLLGHIDHAAGHLDVARERFTRSLALFRDSGVAWGTGDALSGLAEVALATGDVAEAERLLDEAAMTLRDAGTWFLLFPLYLRATLAVRRGDADEAIVHVRDSLLRIRELHDKFAFVYTIVPLAAAASLKGAHGWVARILGARDAVTERTGATAVDHSAEELCGRAERAARHHLGAARWDAAYLAGRHTSIDALLDDIDRTVV
jgi:predicted ATPase/DNA-binding XRE family transcriptional regulator